MARDPERTTPFVSVVIPMRNEARHIGACLEALAAQDYPPDRFEVVVADGESDDGSTGIVASQASRDARFRLCRNPRRTTPYGLNEGIRESRGEIIIILGAHVTVGRDFVRMSAAALERSGAAVAGGVIDAVGVDPFGEAAAAAVSSRFGVGQIAFRQATGEGFVDTVAYAAYRREIFERIGLFDEELVRDQDDELNYRIRKHGGRIFLTPKIRTRYFSRATPDALWRQYFGYGFWKVRVLQKHPSTLKPRHFVPPFSVGAGGALVALAPFDVRALFLAVALAAAYTTGVAAAAVGVARRIGWERFPQALIVFPILHFSYGAGFLTGLVRFLPRWWRPEPEPPALVRADRQAAR